MDDTQRCFLNLLSCGARGVSAESFDGEVDWDALMGIAAEQSVIPSIYVGLVKCPGIPERIIDSARQLAIFRCSRQASAYNELKTLIEKFHSAGIPMLVFKGIVMAVLYPDPAQRISSDADVLIRHEDYSRANELLAANGYVLDEKNEKAHVKPYSNDKLAIDLHSKLWGDVKLRRIELVEKLRLGSFENQIFINALGTQIPTLGCPEHFLYLFIHMAKHFILKGAGIRNLVDIALYFNKYKSEIDADWLWAAIKDFEFTTLAKYLFSICIKYFGMDSSILPDGEELDADIEDALICDILEGGIYGSTKAREVSQSTVMSVYRKGEAKKSMFGLMWMTMFPGTQSLPVKYGYAKRHKILLPVAWIHRLFNFVFNRALSGRRVAVTAVLDQADKRVSLLSAMGIIKSLQEGIEND